MIGKATILACAALALAACRAWPVTAAETPAAPGGATAEACRLLEVADLDMETEIDGEVTVPVSIDDFPGRWLIDTGNVRSTISEATVKRLALTERFSSTPMEMFGGRKVLLEARTATLQIGPMSAHDYPLMVSPADVLPDDTIGMLAPDIMAAYDVEFDFAAGRFKMFSPQHCPGKVVYWTKSSYARVPFDLNADIHIIVDVEIDGKHLDATIDTGTARSTMSLTIANRLFGLTPSSPGMIATGLHSINGLPQTATYRYPFKALNFDGVSVTTPFIEIVDDRGLPGRVSHLLLGVQTLRQLHMYVAYGEQALYLTPAEAR